MRNTLAIAMGMLAAMCMAVGCTGLMESVRGKSINLDGGVYGAKAVAVDPSTGATAPTGEFGFGTTGYNSARMGEGQPYYVRKTNWSIWGDRRASEIEIWIGRADGPAQLDFEMVPGSMVKISGDGTIKSGTTTMTVTPTSESTKTSEVSK